MCGIAGIINNTYSADDLSRIARSMADAIDHRGPDSDGVWVAANSPLALSHRRLSIHDLSPLGAQPMISQSAAAVIVFNGEIYNFKTIRRELESKGYTFKGDSDTEVLLATIEHYGFDTALSKIKGMFSIAYWCEKTQQLFLARDRIGEKPLYYGVVNNSIVFASELKSIYAHCHPRQLTIDKNALSSFLRYGYISAPRTIMQELKKLEPGHKAVINVAGFGDGVDAQSLISTESYWSIDEISAGSFSYGEQDVDSMLKDLDKLFNTIVEEQAVADVPLGAFLSGGIDSSLVSAVLQSQSNVAVDTFTVGFNEATFNEAVYAKKISAHIGSNHNEMILTAADALDVIPKLPEIYDEPFADASQIPTYLVSKFAKSKLSVCLSGDGGDELFAGYNRYIQGEKFANTNQKIPAALRRIMSSTLQHIPYRSVDALYNSANTLLGRKGGANFGSKFSKAAALLNVDSPDHIYQYLCSYSQNPASLFLDETQEDQLQGALAFDKDFMDAGMAWDQQWYLPGDNLVKSDRASMAVSLEMRVPLLDKELIEFSWTLPNTLKYRDGQSKWPLRQMLSHYVPNKLFERPKMGFSIPVGHWICNELNDWATALLSPEFIGRQGIFNYEKISAIFEDHLSGKNDNSNLLWSLLMFQLWYEHYMVD